MGRNGMSRELRRHWAAHYRAFARWLGLELKDAHNWLPAHIGYSKGVPMGGVLTSASGNKAPTLLVAAVKDPI
jgi:hypothetical protein